ncbi:hypothetical protein LCGC14_0812470 [marine sediment metagenome]|uniref:Uncharacterized protein n=1 Tax=marine sediment metagenome TaxID=412755 RepID=A0A0F9Q6I2_9ZZZZ
MAQTGKIIPTIPPNDPEATRRALQKLASVKLGPGASPTFAGLTLTDLTASALAGTNASKLLESVTVGTGLDYTRPTLSLSHLGIEDLTDPDADRILFWDDTASASKWLGMGDSIVITDVTIDTIQDIRTSASPTFEKVGVGTATIPHGGVGYAKLAIDGTSSNAAGPHVQFTITSDNYPLMQILNWRHDDISIRFDSYWDGANKSSDAGSNYAIFKVSDSFKIMYDSGVAKGGAVTWNEGIVLNTSGLVTFGGAINITTIAAEGADVDKFLVDSSGVVKYRTGTQVLSDIDGSASGHNHSGIYEPADAGLTSLAGLTYAAAAFVKMTGANTFALRTLQQTSDDLEATIDHDNLLNFAGNEHYLQSAITAVGTIASGTWQGTTIAINQGGTGQTTAQAAIDALSAVSGGTNEHVLTKDTATGNAKWKAAAGGGGNSQTCDINGTPTTVYTKYFTGTLDADSETLIAHGIATGMTKIISVNGSAYNNSGGYYEAAASWLAVFAGSGSFLIAFDDTNVRVFGVGASVQGYGYKIAIDYID